ncbi:TPA: hypothetical protein T0G97_002143 [Streptococcus suis]|nr:hypothetical protein [Streptococcus suis]
MKKLTKIQKIIIAIIAAVALASTGAYGFTSYQKAQAEALAKSQLEEATQAVEVAEKSLGQDDTDKAAEKVAVLKDEDKKKDLEERLAVVEQLIKTEDLVAKAEKDKTKEAVEAAKTEVDKVADEAKKSAFQKRLDVISAEIAAKEQLAKAEAAVKNAEDSQTRENVAAAQVEVDKVGDATKKAELQKRLDLVSNAIAAKEAEAQAEAAAAAQAQAQTQAQYVAPANNGSTYVAPADNGGGTYTPPANNSGGTQPAGNGGYVTPDLSTPQGQAQQAAQNDQWTQQAGQPGAWDNF